MGVVYKFRKEVIDFVLQQKRTDHDLGCRQLAALISEKFKIQVSKSSVNAIIKNANLSNAVGRPPSDEAPAKKFQIPSQKKQQLLDEVQKIKLEQKPVPPKVLSPHRKDLTLSQPRLIPGPGQHKRAPVVEPRGRGFSQATFLRHIEALRARRAQSKGVLREGMGCVFLKAAQWQLSRTPVLGVLLRKHIPESLPVQFDAFCDMVPCLNLLGVSEFSQMGRLTNHALWHLNGFEQPLADLEISGWGNMIQTVAPSVRFFLEYEKEKRQVFMEAKYFEFYLENGARVMTDACLTGLGEENFSAGFSACVEQAMTTLSHCVISNNQPAIFLSSAGRLSGAVFDMAAAFEGKEGRQIKKAIVFDDEGGPIAEFSMFPRKKRFFMLGVWPGQEEFLLLSKNTKTVEPFYDEVTDKVFYVAAGPASIFEKELKSKGAPLLRKGAPLRSITILASPEGAAVMVILTNCADKAPTDIMRAFLRRWPNLDAGPAGRACLSGRQACLSGRQALHAGGIPGAGNAPGLAEGPASPFGLRRDPAGVQRTKADSGRGGHARSPQEDVPGAAGPAGQNPSLVFPDWGGALNQYCQKHFFGGEFSRLDITQLISTVYSLNGYCAAHEQALLVSLCPPPEYSFAGALQQIVQRVNEAGITDPTGRLLFINIVK